MANSEYDFGFSFKFKLHKSLIPIGIDDNNVKQLAEVYGVREEQVEREVEHVAVQNQLAADDVNREASSFFQTVGMKKIIFLGDSITSDRQSYMNIMKLAFANAMNIEIKDYSISGLKSGDLLTALFPGIIGEGADIAHIMIGTNDMRRTNDTYHALHTGLTEFEKNMEYVVANLTNANVRVIITSIPPFHQQKVEQYFEGYNILYQEEDRKIFNDILKEIASKHHAVYHDMDNRYRKYSNDSLTLPDGIHLSDMGQKLLALQLTEQLEALLA